MEELACKHIHSSGEGVAKLVAYVVVLDLSLSYDVNRFWNSAVKCLVVAGYAVADEDGKEHRSVWEGKLMEPGV